MKEDWQQVIQRIEKGNRVRQALSQLDTKIPRKEVHEHQHLFKHSIETDHNAGAWITIGSLTTILIITIALLAQAAIARSPILEQPSRESRAKVIPQIASPANRLDGYGKSGEDTLSMKPASRSLDDLRQQDEQQQEAVKDASYPITASQLLRWENYQVEAVR